MGTSASKDIERRTISDKKGLDISARSYIASLLLIFALMVLTYVLTLVLPGGEYARVVDESGNTVIDQTAGFTQVQGGLPFWQWLLSPILVLGSESGGTLIAVIIFLIVIGAIFNALDKSGLMRYALDLIAYKFGHARYKLLAIVVLYFMLDGSLVGCFEECVPLVPIAVALAVSLGWDKITGIGMSLLAAGCGFASGISNPFTVGVAQKLAGIPMFSGAWLRIVAFVLIYCLLMLFLVAHAKRVERPVSAGAAGTAGGAAGADAGAGEGAALAPVDAPDAAGTLAPAFESIPQMNRALICFVCILGAGILTVLCSPFIPVLQDYTMIIVAVMYLVAGLVAVNVAKMPPKQILVAMGNGAKSLLPAVLMIMMASSIRYTLEEAHTLDTILNAAVNATAGLPSWSIILFIYAFVLVLNFFVPSGSAKAFMVMPLLVPLCQLFGIPVQLAIMAFAFGDGFSNVFYPTNPVLLISLGLAGTGYGEWFRWVWKFQLANLALTCGILLFGQAIGYC